MKKTLSIILLFFSVSALAFKPFFDDNTRTSLQPEPPVLTALDEDALKLCGTWGGRVEALAFKSMMSKPEHKNSLENIYKALSGKIFSKTDDLREFISQLSRVWFQQKGFKHVFCGEPGRELGGLHYAPRYWQAQQEGWAGFRKLNSNFKSRKYKCRRFYIKDKARDNIFNISVEYKNPRIHKNSVKCLSGYHLDMDAEKLLIAGTDAFKKANRTAGRNQKDVCLVKTEVADVKPHYSTLVIKSRALRTFYAMPDKKPYCKKNKRNLRACLCTNLNR